MTYEKLADLPRYVKRRIEEVSPADDLDRWVLEPIPALGGLSVIEKMNEEDGEQEVLQFLENIEGYFG